jgi:hypothetical protein
MNPVEVYKVRAAFRDFNQRGYYAEDTNNGNWIWASDVVDMARFLCDKRDRVSYDGTQTQVNFYADGYFGRPLIPADAFLLRRLFKKERSELEAEIDKAEAKLQKVRCA